MEYKGGDLMYTQLLLVGYALLLIFTGVWVGIFIEQIINKKQIEHRLYNCEDFCFEHCKIHESVYSSFDDPDDAWKELDGGNHCSECPICYAQWYMDEEAIERWEKRRKKK